MTSITKSDLLPVDSIKRMEEVLDVSWRIFKSQFIHGRHPVVKEAPFQHHFANIIEAMGNLCCIDRSDSFMVDLEAKCENIKNKSKYIDIACILNPAPPENAVKCAIELKFKTAKQGAQDHGRIDAYVDIEAVELACESGNYTFGKFYMITDSTAYLHESKKGVGKDFPVHHGFQSSTQPIPSKSKGREGIVVQLKQPYQFNWQQIDRWYFLDLTIFGCSELVTSAE